MLTCLLIRVAKEKKKGGGNGEKKIIIKKERVEGVAGPPAATGTPGRAAVQRAGDVQGTGCRSGAADTVLTFMSCSAFSAAWA